MNSCVRLFLSNRLCDYTISWLQLELEYFLQICQESNMGAIAYTSESDLCTKISHAESSAFLCTTYTSVREKRNRVEPIQLIRKMAQIYDNIVATTSKQPMAPVSTSLHEIAPHAKV